MLIAVESLCGNGHIDSERGFGISVAVGSARVERVHVLFIDRNDLDSLPLHDGSVIIQRGTVHISGKTVDRVVHIIRIFYGIISPTVLGGSPHIRIIDLRLRDV